ncbi:MAG: 6-pyruvoyl tetrahydropterin synthase family protein [Pirellulaceae bacterium]
MSAPLDGFAERYWVRLCKEDMVFSAAHFITFGGNICERLHGHNYRVAASVQGGLDENHYVVDFIALRDSLQAIVRELDHHVLLPAHHPLIRVHEEGSEVQATFEQRRWLFPADDCVLLPVANTTAELLARYIGQRLLKALAERQFVPEALRVDVDENGGQWGSWEVQLGRISQ